MDSQSDYIAPDEDLASRSQRLSVPRSTLDVMPPELWRRVLKHTYDPDFLDDISGERVLKFCQQKGSDPGMDASIDRDPRRHTVLVQGRDSLMTRHTIGEFSQYEGDPTALTIIMRDFMKFGDRRNHLLWTVLDDLFSCPNTSSSACRSNGKSPRENIKSLHLKLPDPHPGPGNRCSIGITSMASRVFKSRMIDEMDCPVSITLTGIGDQAVLIAHRFSTTNGLSAGQFSAGERINNYILLLMDSERTAYLICRLQGDYETQTAGQERTMRFTVMVSDTYGPTDLSEVKTKLIQDIGYYHAFLSEEISPRNVASIADHLNNVIELTTMGSAVLYAAQLQAESERLTSWRMGARALLKTLHTSQSNDKGSAAS